MHNACYCNELVSLRNRVLMRVPDPDPTFVRQMFRFAHRVGDWLGRFDTPMQGEWMEKYSGRKRTMYENARLDLMFKEFGRSDRFIKSFIKAEKISDVSKDPRMIQARNPRFNYVVGNYLKPIEHRLYRLKGTRHLRKLLPPGRLIAKGLDSRSRAECIEAKMERFRRPVCLSLDASRFDAHVNQRLLSVEHSVYLRAWRGDKTLQRALSYQLVNHGWTANGIRYKCPGGRMSGDMNTALGNCLLMVIIVGATMRELGFKPSQWDMFCDGDDALVFLEASDPRRDLIPVTMEKSGMEMKIERVSTELEDIEFCQCHVARTAEGLKMVRNPHKVLSTALVSNKWFRQEKLIDGHLTRLGLCYLSLSMGVPVLQEFALAMLRCGTGSVLRSHTMSGVMFKAQIEYYAHSGNIAPLPITPQAREDFAHAFEMPVEEQLLVEYLLGRVAL